jgi:hypothetical protein
MYGEKQFYLRHMCKPTFLKTLLRRKLYERQNVTHNSTSKNNKRRIQLFKRKTNGKADQSY